MLYWQDMKNLVEQISIKLGGFYVIKINLVQTVLCAADKSTKLSVKIRIPADIQKVKPPNIQKKNQIFIILA